VKDHISLTCFHFVCVLFPFATASAHRRLECAVPLQPPVGRGNPVTADISEGVEQGKEAATCNTALHEKTMIYGIN
jgi:hypothetical protein